MRIEYISTPQPRQITHLALNLRFTRAERDAIRTSSDADVQDVLFLFDVARYIDLDRVETVAGLNMLEAKGLLGAGRAQQIIEQQVEPHERP